MKLNDRTGERFISNEGCEFIIIKYNNCDDLWVQFQDEYRAIIHTQYGNCIKKTVKNPYYKSIYEQGMCGINACLLGLQKTSGGYRWYKVGDEYE